MRHGVYFEHTSSSECGVLLPNHLASSLSDASGDRAQYLSNTLHMPVFAYERPSTADLGSRSAFTTDSYLEDASERAKKIHKVLDVLGIERVVVAGNSAGALDALAIAGTGELTVERVVAIEPVALRKVHKSTGVTYFKSQMAKGKTELDEEEYKSLEHLEKIREPASTMRLAKRMIKEIKAYGDVYRSDIGLTILRSLADNQPGVPVNLILGNRSLVTTAELREEMLDEFADSSVHMEVKHNATHSFADPLNYFVHLVETAMQPLAILSQDTELVDKLTIAPTKQIHSF